MERPDFFSIPTYEEFSKYYWYREELKEICKRIGADDSGGKQELNAVIKAYFDGHIIPKKKTISNRKVTTCILTLDTPLLACGFCFNQTFRSFFEEQTGISPFKFNTDMVATAKKVKEDGDLDFTLQDLLDIYYGKKEYAKYDASSCQWNRFLKDFCQDEVSKRYTNKLKAAAILWEQVRNSTRKKVYSREVFYLYENLLQDYLIC